MLKRQNLSKALTGFASKLGNIKHLKKKPKNAHIVSLSSSPSPKRKPKMKTKSKSFSAMDSTEAATTKLQSPSSSNTHKPNKSLSASSTSLIDKFESFATILSPKSKSKTKSPSYTTTVSYAESEPFAVGDFGDDVRSSDSELDHEHQTNDAVVSGLYIAHGRSRSNALKSSDDISDIFSTEQNMDINCNLSPIATEEKHSDTESQTEDKETETAVASDNVPQHIQIATDDDYANYYDMSPLPTPPEPNDAPTAADNSDRFAVLQEGDEGDGNDDDGYDDDDDDLHYETSVSLTAENMNDNDNGSGDRKSPDTEMLSICELLMQNGLKQNEHSFVYDYFLNFLQIQFAYEICDYSPNQILCSHLLNNIDNKTVGLIQKLLSFVSFQIATKKWQCSYAKNWLQFEQQKLHQNRVEFAIGYNLKQTKTKYATENEYKEFGERRVLSPSVDDSAFMLFDSESNRIQMGANSKVYLAKQVQINEVWAFTFQIETYAKAKNSNQNVFEIGFEFLASNDTLVVNDKFQVFRNEKYLATIAQHRCDDDMEMDFVVENKRNASTVKVKADDVNDEYFSFGIGGAKPSMVNIFVQHWVGRGDYGIYPPIVN